MKRSQLNLLFDSPWDDVPRLCQQVIPLGADLPSRQAVIDAVMDYEPRKGDGWITGVLRKQIPIATRLAVAGEIPDVAFLGELSRAFAQWSSTVLDEGTVATLADFPAGPFRARIGRDLIRILCDMDKSVPAKERRRPVMALMQLAPMEVTEDIQALLNHSDQSIGGYACSLLSFLGVDTAIPRLMEMFESEDDWGLRSRAATALGQMRFKPALEIMLRIIRDPDVYKALGVADGLLRYGSPKALKALVSAMEGTSLFLGLMEMASDSTPDLSLACTRDRTRRLKRKLKSGREGERDSAARLLGALKAVEATGALVEALADESEDVRQAACGALAEIGARDTVPNLVELLDDPEMFVRMAATDALAKLEAKEALEPLLSLLHRPQRERWEIALDRGEAARALGSLGCKEAIKPLIRALRDEDSTVRMGAAEGLGWLEAKEALRPLKKALKDYEISVAWNAGRALGRIGARDAAPEIIHIFETGTEKGLELEGYYETLWLLSSAPRPGASRGK